MPSSPERPIEKPPFIEGDNRGSQQGQESVAPGGISDQPIETAKNDALGFEPYVDAVANFLTDESTKPPLTMSIEGEWGSGKSSFMKMLAEKLRHKKQRTIEFNAWRHDKADSLWSAFALQLSRKLTKSLPFYRRPFAAAILFSRRFRFWQGWFDAARTIAFLGLFAASAWTIAIVAKNHGAEFARAAIETIAPESKSKERPLLSPSASASDTDTGKKATDTAKELKEPIEFVGFAAALALAISFLIKFKELFGNPFSIDLAKYARSPKYEDQISFIERFHDDFAKIVHTYVKKNERVFVFIDDLDRCEVPKAADLVQGLNLLISDVPNFVFVIGMDRAKVAAALAIKFEKALPYLAPKLKPLNADGGQRENRDDATLGGLSFGYGFIEKFIQIPFRVPQPVNEMERFFRSLSGDIGDTGPAEPVPTEPEQEAFSLALKNDSQRVRLIGLAMAPAFDYNPRRLKQFLNLFRLQAFIAFRTGLFRGENALTLEQLGKFVTLSLRWPLLFSDVTEEPSLIADLERRALERAPTDSSDVFDNGEGETVGGAEEPFSRWTDNDDLEKFLRLKIIVPQTKIIGAEWSFETVDIPRLLRVSPAIKMTAGRLSQTEGFREEEIGLQETATTHVGGPLPYEYAEESSSKPGQYQERPPFPSESAEGDYAERRRSGRSSARKKK